jgi:LEA14-like dessication related protein
MTLSLRHIIVGLISVCLFTSCLEYEDVEFMGVDDYTIDQVSASEVKITLKMKVKNPNSYNIKIKKSSFDIFLNDKELGETRMKDDVKLLKNSTDVYEVEFVSNLKDLSKGIFSSLGMLLGGSSKLRIKGEAKAKAFGIGKKFDVDFIQDIKASDFKF